MMKKLWGFFLAPMLWPTLGFCFSVTSATGFEADLYPAQSLLDSPGIVLLQGANVDKQEYSLFAGALAENGFHVIVPNVSRKVAGMPQEGLFTLEETVVEALEVLKKENETLSSVLYHRVDGERLGLVGHSFGGMVGLLAVDGRCLSPFCLSTYRRPTELKAAVFLGTSTYSQGNYFPVNTAAVPVALISGELDSGAPPFAVEGTFGRIASPKAWIEVANANHFAMTNHNPSPGAKPDPNPQTISQNQSIAITAEWTSKFLRAFVIDDADSQDDLMAAVVHPPQEILGVKISFEQRLSRSGVTGLAVPLLLKQYTKSK